MYSLYFLSYIVIETIVGVKLLLYNNIFEGLIIVNSALDEAGTEEETTNRHLPADEGFDLDMLELWWR